MIGHIVFSVLMRDAGFMPCFAFGVYVLFFSANSGRWVRELMLPWVYRIPAASFTKLLWCLRESVQEVLLQSVIMMGASGIIVGEKPAVIIAGIVCHFLLALLFMSGNLAGDRLYGQIQSRAIALLLYALVMIVLLAPSVALLIAALVKGWVFVSVNFTLVVMMALPTLILIPLCLFFARRVLDNVEMNN